jgi:hypothetical protein
MWNVLTGMAIALSLWGTACVIVGVAMSWRLRAAHRVIEAAERFEAVNLSAVVKRYVPSEQQTQRAAEEMAIAKRVINSRRLHWRRATFISAVLALCSAGATVFALQRDLSAMSTAQLAAKPVAQSLNALKFVQGVWGWRADFLQSCEQNPQTISVAQDGKKLSIRYAKPLQLTSGSATEFDYDVMSVEPGMLVLTKIDSPTSFLPRVYFQFIDQNSFTVSWSNHPAGSSGTIARCN